MLIQDHNHPNNKLHPNPFRRDRVTHISTLVVTLFEKLYVQLKKLFSVFFNKRFTMPSTTISFINKFYKNGTYKREGRNHSL